MLQKRTFSKLQNLQQLNSKKKAFSPLRHIIQINSTKIYAKEIVLALPIQAG